MSDTYYAIAVANSAAIRRLEFNGAWVCSTLTSEPTIVDLVRNQSHCFESIYADKGLYLLRGKKEGSVVRLTEIIGEWFFNPGELQKMSWLERLKNYVPY